MVHIVICILSITRIALRIAINIFVREDSRSLNFVRSQHKKIPETRWPKVREIIPGLFFLPKGTFLLSLKQAV